MANMTGDELLKLFTEYAVKEGSNQLLSMTGLNNLLQNHFSNLMVSLSKIISNILSYLFIYLFISRLSPNGEPITDYFIHLYYFLSSQ